MDRDDVFNTVAELINRSLSEKKKITMESRLEDDLGMDSIAFVELGVGLENKYCVDIDDEVLESFKTVQEVVEAVLEAPVYDDVV